MRIGEIREICELHGRDMERMGWSDTRKSDAHYKMLVVDEICEAIQSHRKGRVRGDGFIERYLDDEQVGDKVFMSLFERECKDTTTDELADAFLRLLSLAWMRGYEIAKPIYLPPIREKEMFTETAWGLTSMMVKAERDSVAVMKGIFFIDKWCETLGVDLLSACKRKMRYNRIRNDWKNGEKAY